MQGRHPLAGSLAVVTGCTLGGIGAETARALAGEAGLVVVCAGRSPARLAAAAADLAASHPAAPAVVPMALDVGDLASVRAFARALDRRFPPRPPRRSPAGGAGLLGGYMLGNMFGGGGGRGGGGGGGDGGGGFFDADTGGGGGMDFAAGS